MNYGNIKFHDIADGPGVRTSLFVSGCTHRCRGCFQPETWDFGYGKPYDANTESIILDSMSDGFVSGLTVLGGEPFEPSNQESLLNLYKRMRTDYPEKTIWCYTGYTWEELTGDGLCRCRETDEILSLIDVLVDGPFVESKKDLTLLFRGSSNQRIIDVPESLAAGEIVLWTATATARGYLDGNRPYRCPGSSIYRISTIGYQLRQRKKV